MRSNIRPFRPKGNTPSEWPARLIAAAVYVLLAYLFRFPSENDLTLLFLLGIVYWILIQQKRFEVPYFLRYHLLQALILYFWLVLAFLLLGALFNVFIVSVHLFQLGGFVDPLLVNVFSFVPWTLLVLMLGLGLGQAIMALLGKTPTLPGITDNVRRWV